MPYTATQKRHALRLARTNGVADSARETAIDPRTIKRWIKADEKELATMDPVVMPAPELTAVKHLTPHPRNYRDHPEDQIDHLVQSIRDHGVYRNVVTANDGTILAGHGVVLAAQRLDLKEIPAIRLDIDPDSPAALKLLAADNYLSHFAADDDRVLTDLLKDVADLDDLFGTGFDEQSLAALLMVTRDGSEIADLDEAAEWVGMPEFDHTGSHLRMIIHFTSEDDRVAVADLLGVDDERTIRQGVQVWSLHWPPRRQDDPKSVIFE